MTSDITSDDFTAILADMTRTVSYQEVTKTVDPVTGDEILVYGTAADKGVVFFLEENRYLFDKEGLIEVGDAYIMSPLTFEPQRMDKFSIDGYTYLVKNVTKRYVTNVAMHYFAVCYLSEV